MTDDTQHDDKQEPRPDHEPPPGAEITATWSAGKRTIDYTASAKWFVLRKKDKPAAEIFSVSYVANEGDADRPVMFVFNGGPGASSAFLHMGAVGPQRVDFPADGSLPTMPPRLVTNEESWLAFADLVFVDPIGTGFSRVIETDKKRRVGRRRARPRARRTTRPTRRSTSATSATWSRCASSSAAGCPPTDAGRRRSSSPARATAATESGGSRGCCRRPRGSGSTARS